MATEYIEAVRVVNPSNHRYGHIAYVRLISGHILARSDVIHDIMYRRATYYTYASNLPQAKVIIGDCPDCGSGDYITTEPDYTPENNLLSLPRF